MKRFAIFQILFSFVLLMAASFTSHAQPIMIEKSKQAIHRTATVIQAAHDATATGQVFTGNLKKAVLHQQFAIQLFSDGKYIKAVHHSRRARELARMQIEANMGTTPAGFEATADEASDGPAPAPEELDAALSASLLNKTTEDESAIAAKPLTGIDINE